MRKVRLYRSRWFFWGDRYGGFHVGFFVDWEPEEVSIGVDLGIWCFDLVFARKD